MSHELIGQIKTTATVSSGYERPYKSAKEAYEEYLAAKRRQEERKIDTLAKNVSDAKSRLSRLNLEAVEKQVLLSLEMSQRRLQNAYEQTCRRVHEIVEEKADISAFIEEADTKHSQIIETVKDRGKQLEELKKQVKCEVDMHLTALRNGQKNIEERISELAVSLIEREQIKQEEAEEILKQAQSLFKECEIYYADDEYEKRKYDNLKQNLKKLEDCLSTRNFSAVVIGGTNMLNEIENNIVEKVATRVQRQEIIDRCNLWLFEMKSFLQERDICVDLYGETKLYDSSVLCSSEYSKLTMLYEEKQSFFDAQKNEMLLQELVDFEFEVLDLDMKAKKMYLDGQAKAIHKEAVINAGRAIEETLTSGWYEKTDSYCEEENNEIVTDVYIDSLTGEEIKVTFRPDYETDNMGTVIMDVEQEFQGEDDEVKEERYEEGRGRLERAILEDEALQQADASIAIQCK